MNINLEDKLQSALVVSMCEELFDQDDGNRETELFDTSDEKAKFNYRNWGVFKIIDVHVSTKWKTRNKSILTGQAYSPEGIALYLAETNNKLSLSGKTEIKGPCYLPERGISKARIQDKEFIGNLDILHKGNSQKTLPILAKNLLNIISSLKKNVSLTQYHVPDEARDADFFINYFSDPTLLVPISDGSELSGHHYVGNFILFCDTLVTIPRDAILEDIILMAPSVKFEDGFIGNLQVFSTEKIEIGNECKIKMPSFLGVISREGERESNICIGKDNIILSDIVLYRQGQVSEDVFTLIIGSGSHVYGKVYCNQWAEIKGEVRGSLYCNKLIHHTPVGSYHNSLVDGVINYYLLPSEMVHGFIFDEKIVAGEIKWLQ